MRKEQVLDLEKVIGAIKPSPAKEDLRIKNSRIGGLNISPFIMDIPWPITYKDRKYIIPIGTPMAILDFIPDKGQSKSSILLDGLRAVSSFSKKIAQVEQEEESPIIPILLYGSTPNEKLAKVACHLGFIRIDAEDRSRKDFAMLTTVDTLRSNFGELIGKSIGDRSFWVQLKYRELREKRSR